MNRLTALMICTLLLAPLAQADTRQPVSLEARQQAFVLDHMKSMLETIGAIQADLAQGKPQQVAQRVQQLKQHESDTKPQRLGRALPAGFRSMSKAMNQHWQVLLQPSQDDKKIQQQLHLLLNQCNACHRSYRLER